MRFKVLLAIGDQGLLSLLSFIAGALFVRYGTKTEFADYALVVSALTLASSFQAAGLTTPLTSLAAQLKPGARASFCRGFSRLNIILAVLCAVVVAVCFSLLPIARDQSLFLALACAFAVGGLWVREFQRTELYLHDLVRLALRTTALSVLVSLSIIAVLLGAGHPMTAELALVAFATGSVLAAVLGTRANVSSNGPATTVAEAAAALAPYAKWSLPWTALTWLQNGAFAFIAGVVVSHEAIADVSAGRLLLAPIGLVIAGWARVYLPQAGAEIGSANIQRAWRLTTQSAIALGGIVVLYGGGATLAYHSVLSAVLPDGYRQLGVLVLAWGVYFLANVLRGVGTSALLTMGRFRTILGITLPGVAVGVASSVVLGGWIGASGVIYGMAIGEGVVCGGAWRAYYQFVLEGERSGNREAADA